MSDRLRPAGRVLSPESPEAIQLAESFDEVTMQPRWMIDAKQAAGTGPAAKEIPPRRDPA